MNVRMLTAIAGNLTAEKGQIVKLSDEEAKRFIAAGIGEATEDPHQVEYQVARASGAPERATARKAASR